MPQQRDIKLLIFDFDGTIADSAEGIIKTVNTFLSLYRKPVLPPHIIKNHIGLGLRQLLENIFSDLDESFLDQPEMYADFIKLYNQNCLYGMTTFSGLEDFLKTWHHSLAIVSNKFEQFLKPSLEHLKLDNFNWLEVIGRDTLDQHKPHPLPLETCLNTAQVKPEECLMIGDGIADIKAAAAANIESVAVRFGYGPIDDLIAAGADHVLHDYNQLHDLINLIKSNNYKYLKK